jgi:hypothetical protein
MLVDTTDHPIMKDDVKHMSIQAQEILTTTVPDKRENDIVREKREPHKHRHEDRTDWAETLLSLTDDEMQLPAPTECPKRSKKNKQKENCLHIVNEHEAKRARQRHRNYNPNVTTTISTIHDSRIQSNYAKY